MSSNVPKYEPVIGLEVHAQLQTESKLFCGCRVSYGETPNSLTCPVCLGHPGALPVLNRKAVDFAVRLIVSMDGEVQLRSGFARKNYFYPDLPKGYQITQYEHPLGRGGELTFRLPDGETQRCRIDRVHLEEDAGKLLHTDDSENPCLIDHNRCGSPLVEIVGAPDIKSPETARAYLEHVKLILQYLGICSGDMEKGHLRCDANVSLRPIGDEQPGIRTELKNLNSFRGVQRALEYEIRRQTEVLEQGETVEPMALLWDENRAEAVPMRSKEGSSDYRYLTEPDLPDLVLEPDWVQSIQDNIPELPAARRERFVGDYGLSESDASVLTASRVLSDFFQDVVSAGARPGPAAGWVTVELIGRLKASGQTLENCKVTADGMAELLGLMQDDTISGKIAKNVLNLMLDTGERATHIVREKGLALITDEKELRSRIDRLLAEHESEAAAYRDGNNRLLAFFVGQIMQATSGRAHPALTNRLLKEKLEE